jgi:hypothetical protein
MRLSVRSPTSIYDSIFDVNVKGLLFYRSKGRAADAARIVHRPQCLDCRQQRLRIKQRIQRDQGGGAFVRTHLDDGFEGSADSP